MRILLIAGTAFAGLLIGGCTKSIKLKTDKNRPQYVIEGRVSSLKGPYYVRVTRVSDLNSAYTPDRQDTTRYRDNAEPVTNAQVIIWDEAGDSDTLKPVHQTGVPRYEYTYWGNKWDSTIKSSIPPNLRERGYYTTTHLMPGKPGHTYHLKVVIGDEEFQASAYMPLAPAMDSAIAKETNDEAYGAPIRLPYAYFKEPRDEKNYYMLQYLSRVYDYPYDFTYSYNFEDNRTLPFSVIDDTGLPAYVNGLPALLIFSSKERSTEGWPYYNWVSGAPSQLRLHALTKETYNYYRQLQKQFEDDGNVYKPTPASPAGNISNGAVGLFYAADITYSLMLPK